MSTGYFRESVNNEFATPHWIASFNKKRLLQFAVKTILFLLLVNILAFVAGSPNDRRRPVPTTHQATSTSPEAIAEPVTEAMKRAICVIRPVGDSGVSGTLHLVNRGDAIEIRGAVEGLTPGKHGFHIHEFGDLSDDKAGKSAGGHFNPTDQPHGRQESSRRHVGDLGNIEAGGDGKANVDIRDRMIQFDGTNSIIGRSIVIHADADKFIQPAGDAGARVAFGVIGIAASE